MRYFTIALLALIPALAGAQDVVVVCPIEGMIDEGVAVVVERAVEEAEAVHAKAIVFRVDTPGGRVDSAVEIASTIKGTPIRTIAFIEGMGAISAGALISLACDDLIMTSSSNIGAATPVIPSPQGMLPTGEKEVSFMRAKMRALAESNGHNPDIAQAMVDKDVELRAYTDSTGEYVVYGITLGESDSPAHGFSVPSEKSRIEKIIDVLRGDLPMPAEGPAPAPTEAPRQIEAIEEPREPGAVVYEDGSELVLAKGKLLTLTPNEAVKFGLIPGIVDDLDAVIDFYELGDVDYVAIVPNWAERLFRFLTSATVAGLLLMLGMGGLYFEVKTPGFGVPGIIAAVCLTLFFGSHYILGLTEAIDVLLVLVGIILVLVEIFLLPGFGVAGVAGMCCLAAGIYLSLVNFTIPEYSWQFDRLGEVAYTMGVAFATFVVFVLASWKLLPRTPLYGMFVMQGTQEIEDGYVIQTEEDAAAAVGLTGTASSMLRPAGRGRFGDKNYMVVSRGDYIPEGTPIAIVQVDGNRYVVDPVDAEEELD